MTDKAALQSPSILLNDPYRQHDPPYDYESRKHGYHTTPPGKRQQFLSNAHNHQQKAPSNTKKSPRENIGRPPSLKDHRDQLNELFTAQEQLDKASKERNWFYEENSLLKYQLHILQYRIHHAEALWHQWIQQQPTFRWQDSGTRHLCTSTLIEDEDSAYLQPSVGMTTMIQPTQPFFPYAAKPRKWHTPPPLYKAPVWQRRHKAL